jgi:hypothetical protein
MPTLGVIILFIIKNKFCDGYLMMMMMIILEFYHNAYPNERRKKKLITFTHKINISQIG